MSNIKKLYIAYKSGYMGENILNAYFSFFANIILRNHLSTIKDEEIAKKFQEEYDITLPLSFVRQVLGEGVRKKCFIPNRGVYSADFGELASYKFDNRDFENLWDSLISKFKGYCTEKAIDLGKHDIEKFILDALDSTDFIILSGDVLNDTEGLPPLQYAWYSFVRKLAEADDDLYSFVVSLSASNIAREAIFYNPDMAVDYTGLHIYLDSPIVFAILGMDEDVRVKSYQALVSDMIKAGCEVHVAGHNFQEIDGILARASQWANSTSYDISKANNAARYFHDSGMRDEDIVEFCTCFEDKLNRYGITVKNLDYDVTQNEFQEDEAQLFDMITAKYREQGRGMRDDMEESIRVDVRSIIMIYRERRGITATRIDKAQHLMLTSNNAIANVSKKYESNSSNQAGHIPACISADLFGAILWLNSPMEMMEYQKQKLLADCYSYLKPSRKLLDKYIESLNAARDADQIDEKTFLFLRSHKVVLNSLMDVTRGDYARFNSQTYLEVYDDIVAKEHQKGEQKYVDEVAAHDLTRRKLEEIQAQRDKEKLESDAKYDEMSARVAALEKEKRQVFEQKVIRWGKALTFFFVIIPYVVCLIVIEIIKGVFLTVTSFTDVTWFRVAQIAVIVILTIIIPTLFQKGKAWSFKKVREYFEKKEKMSN